MEINNRLLVGCWKAVTVSGAVIAFSPASQAMESPPRFDHSQLVSMCVAKRDSVAKCECYVKTMKKSLPADEVNLIFWIMWADPPRGKAYAAAKRQAEPQWSKGFAQRAGHAMTSMNTNCTNVF
jgi:hypothetical protein